MRGWDEVEGSVGTAAPRRLATPKGLRWDLAEHGVILNRETPQIPEARADGGDFDAAATDVGVLQHAFRQEEAFAFDVAHGRYAEFFAKENVDAAFAHACGTGKFRNVERLPEALSDVVQKRLQREAEGWGRVADGPVLSAKRDYV